MPDQPGNEPSTALAWLAPFEGLGRFAAFAFDVFRRLPTVVARPGELAMQCYHVGVGSLPLVLAASASIGVVSWLQTRSMLADYGSETLLPGFVAVFVVVGLAPVLTGLVVAGQVGARLSAELGSMKITEQIDALQAMGLSPVVHLAATRAAACILMAPLLTVCLDFFALGASYVAEWLGGSLSAAQYFRESLRFLKISNVAPATCSSFAFGFLIGVVGCWFGLNAGQGATEVGKASTRGVASSMLAVLLMNVVWVRSTEILLKLFS